MNGDLKDLKPDDQNVCTEEAEKENQIRKEIERNCNFLWSSRVRVSPGVRIKINK